MECDAFGRGMGMMLMQYRKIITYFSKAIKEHLLSRSVYKKDLMDLVYYSATLVIVSLGAVFHSLNGSMVIEASSIAGPE